jgi:Fur family ferric uptake transcriptional regulator
MPESLPRAGEWLACLESGGYRLTAPRRAIVEILAATDFALGPLEIFDRVRQDTPGVGLVTVYRTLEKLEETGLVQRVHLPGGCHRYLRAARGHQHLLICTACGRVRIFEGDDLDGFIGAVAARTGFAIRDHWLQLYGLCPTCNEINHR